MKGELLVLACLFLATACTGITFDLDVSCRRNINVMDNLMTKKWASNNLKMMVPIFFKATLTVTKSDTTPGLQYKLVHNTNHLTYPFKYIEVVVSESQKLSSWQGFSFKPVWAGSVTSGMRIGSPTMRVDIKGRYLGGEWLCTGTQSNDEL